jgi:hypothetical protein
MGAPKTASAGERPVSSLGCARSPRSTKGNSSDQVAAAARTQRAPLRRRSFDCSVRLRMVSSCLFVGDVKHLAQLKPKVRSKLRAAIESDHFGNAKTRNPSKS